MDTPDLKTARRGFHSALKDWSQSVANLRAAYIEYGRVLDRLVESVRNGEDPTPSDVRAARELAENVTRIARGNAPLGKRLLAADEALAEMLTKTTLTRTQQQIAEHLGAMA